MFDSCLAFVDLDTWWDRSLGSGCPSAMLVLELHMIEYMGFLIYSVQCDEDASHHMYDRRTLITMIEL
jgi:hypothetical protein